MKAKSELTGRAIYNGENNSSRWSSDLVLIWTPVYSETPCNRVDQENWLSPRLI